MYDDYSLLSYYHAVCVLLWLCEAGQVAVWPRCHTRLAERPHKCIHLAIKGPRGDLSIAGYESLMHFLEVSKQIQVFLFIHILGSTRMYINVYSAAFGPGVPTRPPPVPLRLPHRVTTS